jgi:hypothetical protein
MGIIGEVRPAIDRIHERLAHDIDYYDKAASKAKRAFLSRIYCVRLLVGLGGILFILSGLRAEAGLIDLLRLTGDDAEFWHNVATCTGLAGAFLASVGGLLLQDVSRRGHRRAWLRYSTTLGELDTLRNRFEFHRSVYQAGAADRTTEAIAMAISTLEAMESFVGDETRQWAKDADRDFGDLIDLWAKKAKEAAERPEDAAKLPGGPVRSGHSA